MNNISNVDIAKTVRTNFKEYAEEVNLDRAIIDLADGLKPVQRRILWSMHQNKQNSSKKHVKTAEVVGAVMGQYHPHGDSSIDGAIVRMSQDFILSEPMIDWHGNNGSIDDPLGYAANRYTECRLSKYAEAILSDIDYETTEFQDNYIQTKKEPVRINTFIPNALINPQLGIGVAMACNWAPHSYTAIKQAIVDHLNHNSISLSPSFGCTIVNGADLNGIYKRGKGTIILRADYHWEKNNLIITALPYRVGPKVFLAELEELQETKNLFPQIKEANNFSAETLNITIEVSSSADKDKLIAALCKHTSFETQFHLNQTALVDGKPKLLSFTQILDYYIKQQHTRLINKNAHIKNAAAAKLHIQEGLLLALSSIDEVIAIIRAADDTDDARTQLIKLLSISKEQADAILDIKLSRLTKLSAQSITDLITSLKAEIAEAEDIIASPERRISVLYAELDSIQQTSTSETTVLNESSILNKLGQQVSEPFKLTIDDTSYHTSDGDLVSPEDPLYIITEESKVILLKAAALKYAEDFTPLQDALPNIKQKIIGAFTTLPASLTLYSSIGEETFKKDILEYAATPRGRRLSTKKTTFQIKQ